MKLLEKLAKKYCQSVDDDCLCQRTQPGTKFGEHIYCFCGCGISKAYESGFNEALELTVDRVQYSRFSIVLQDDNFTRGYIKACQDIKERIEKLGEEEVK